MKTKPIRIPEELHARLLKLAMEIGCNMPKYVRTPKE